MLPNDDATPDEFRVAPESGSAANESLVSQTGDGTATQNTSLPNAVLPISTVSESVRISPVNNGNDVSQGKSTRHHENSFLGSLFWVLCCVAFVVGLWQLGPVIAERYQYAMARGKIRAEYEGASEILESNPLANLSIASQLVAKKIRPSVVSVECEKLAVVDGETMHGQGQGSGVVISADGYIVTNQHVVENVASFDGRPNIIVRLADQFTYPATLIGTDSESDLAVLKIEAPGLVSATWGDSDELAVGSMVWAVGSPFGYDQTITSGIVSGKNRLTNTGRNRATLKRDLLQTDAAVNPGNSGGPLVDAQGDVVGINTSILGDTYQGISFAVPSAVAKFVSEQLIKFGKVKRGFFGFVPHAVTQDIYEQLSLPDLQGALVGKVEPGTPADEAGLRIADVIRSWNGKPIENSVQVYNFIAVTPPGKNINVEVFRDGVIHELTVRVNEGPR